MIQLIITVIIILILLISLMPSLIKESFYACNFVPWGKTKTECAETCVNSSYKDLYSDRTNCNTNNCNVKCNDCTSNTRCLWNTPTVAYGGGGEDIPESLTLSKNSQSCSNQAIIITITTNPVQTTSSTGSTSSTPDEYIIHYIEEGTNKINMMDLKPTTTTISFRVNNSYAYKVLKQNKKYKIIVYGINSDSLICKSNILSVDTTNC
jgi:hypothetical protein